MTTTPTPAAVLAATMPDLLPCPFCGTQPRIVTMRDESIWSHDEVLKTQVHCGGCDVSTDFTEEGQDPEAVEKWNTRPAAVAPDDTMTLQEVWDMAGGAHAMDNPTRHQVELLLHELDSMKPRAPDGWVMVPVDPTIKQMAAMGPAIRACYRMDGVDGNVTGVYAAALEAAPTPPASTDRAIWEVGRPALPDDEMHRIARDVWGYVSQDHSRMWKFGRAIQRAVGIYAPEPPCSSLCDHCWDLGECQRTPPSGATSAEW